MDRDGGAIVRVDDGVARVALAGLGGVPTILIANTWASMRSWVPSGDEETESGIVPILAVTISISDIKS